MSKRNCEKRKAEATSSFEDEAKKSKTVCVFCLSAENDEIQYGETLTQDDVTCHYFCLLLASGLYQNAQPNAKSSLRGFLLDDIRSEVKRGFRLKCYYCQEKGATLGCCAKKCKKAFHLPCARANGSLHQFFKGFGSYCDEHRPKQAVSDECENSDDLLCNICLGSLDVELSSIDTLHSPCCKNSWFHRNCIQQYAISAGMHHFKCPMCNCGKKFIDEMMKFGVYVPDQDASWERQSGAFDELLERYSRCDADICSCPSGRNHDAESGKYNLLLCSCCGSFGSHRTCRGLVWYESSLMCPFCAEIEKNFVEPERKERLKASRMSNSQSEASTSRAMQESVIHIEMADDEEDIDIDGDLHVPPFLRNSLSRKIIRRAMALPSCSLVLHKVDEVIGMFDDTINLKKIPGFTYYRKRGLLIRNAAGLKRLAQEKANARVEITHEPTNETQDRLMNRNVDEMKVRKDTVIKQFDGEDDSVEEEIVSCQQERKCTKRNKRQKEAKKRTPRRLRSSQVLSKVRTSPLSSMKKQKALKFLMNFNQLSHQKRPYKKRNSTSPILSINKDSQANSQKKLVQSTLMFFKKSSNLLLSKSNRQESKPELLKINSPCKKGTKIGYEVESGSIATTPHKRAVKVSERPCSNISSVNSPSKNSIDGDGKDLQNTSIATTPHKREAKTGGVEKNDFFAKSKSGRKDISAANSPSMKRVDMERKELQGISIATTPHKRVAKVSEGPGSNILGGNSPSKKRLDADGDDLQNTSIATTPHKREAKANGASNIVSMMDKSMSGPRRDLTDRFKRSEVVHPQKGSYWYREYGKVRPSW